MLTGYSPTTEAKSLPAIVPVLIKGMTWAYLDTGFGRNFISGSATSASASRIAPSCHHYVFDVTLISVDGRAIERVDIVGSSMPNFTTVKRPTLKELKEKYGHARDKTFYMTENEEYPIHIILRDSTDKS